MTDGHSLSQYPLRSIRRLVLIRASNVDKVVEPDEHPVKLCNYVDVYYNERITDKIPFSSGSALPREISKFALRNGDVLITKDSESPDDIAVPALVDASAAGVVCGYHLAILRADPSCMRGDFLFWSLKSRPIVESFSIRAQGITRYGLTLNGIGSVLVPTPNLPTQQAIADFLDRETARIDQLIEKKERLNRLLAERIAGTVSRWIAPQAEYEEVRVEHDLPSPRLRTLVSLNPSGSAVAHLPDNTEVTFAPMDVIADGLGGLDARITRSIGELRKGSYNYFAEGDILLAKVTPCFENGKKAIAMCLRNGVGFATSEVFVIRPDTSGIHPNYLNYLLSSQQFRASALASMTGAGGLRRVSEEAVLNYRLPVVDVDRQRLIADQLDLALVRLELLVEKTRQSITKLRESRAALITAAVTGQIDVATWGRRGETDRRLEEIELELEPASSGAAS